MEILDLVFKMIYGLFRMIYIDFIVYGSVKHSVHSNFLKPNYFADEPNLKLNIRTRCFTATQIVVARLDLQDDYYPCK